MSFDSIFCFCSSVNAAIPKIPKFSLPSLIGVHISASSLQCSLLEQVLHLFSISLLIIYEFPVFRTFEYTASSDILSPILSLNMPVPAILYNQ